MAAEETRPTDLTARVKSIRRAEDQLEVTVRLKNKAKRALHYISDVRATRFDPGTKTLTICLSDEGREVIPGAVSRLPAFRFIDPEAEADIEVRIPDRIVKLSRNVPPGQLAFERFDLSQAAEVVVEVAWSDVPYYTDTRKHEDMRLPAARWERHKARTRKRMG